MLIEAAWSYRFPARISREQLLRQEGLAKPIRDTAWKAQERLCRRYRKLSRAGKSPTVVTTAIARELAAFAWAIAKHTFKPLTLDALEIDGGHHEKEVNAENDLSKTEQGWRHGHGQENPRVHYQPDSFRRWPPRQRKLRDASPVRRYPTRASEHDQPSF